MPVVTWTQDGDRQEARSRLDEVAVEEALALSVRAPGQPPIPLVITMRTPGADAELALGFLYGEGLVRAPSDVEEVVAEADDAVTVTLTAEAFATAAPKLPGAARSTVTTAACGVCGKTSLDALAALPVHAASVEVPSAVFPPAAVAALGDRFRSAQATFARTGGLHAAGAFTVGEPPQLVALREDVGRHNAVDKLVGVLLQANALPARRHLLFVSGRASYELVQKALAAGFAALAAVGAPSSRAVALAREHGLGLVGFVRAARLNVYATPERFGLPALPTGVS